MCLEDISIGRTTRYDFNHFALTASSQRVVDRNESRTVLIFGAPSSGRVTIRPKEVVAAGIGFTLAPGNPPLLFELQKHGDIVREPWFAIGEAIGDSITSEWSVSGTGNNATATATKTGVAGSIHRVFSISGGYDTVTTDKKLWIQDGIMIIQNHIFSNSIHLEFPRGLRFTSGNDAKANIPAGGAGVEGNVTITGDTIITGTATGTLPIYEGLINDEFTRDSIRRNR